MTTRDFILAHRNDNIRELALTHKKNEDVDMAYALEQIAGWQTACRKLPSWAGTDGIIYPPRLSMEQCSSEQTARYKASVVARLLTDCTVPTREETSFTDLTGGFGVDFSFMARETDKAVYVEQDSRLCDIARTNMSALGINHAKIVCADASTYLDTMRPVTMIYLDPARRDRHGGKTVAMADCTPDITSIHVMLMAKARIVMVKLSPMLDWHKAVADMHGRVSEVHIVSADGECKELLLVLRANNTHDRPKLFCSICTDNSFDLLECPDGNNTVATIHDNPAMAKYMYEPNPSVMKAGCFGLLTERFGVKAAGTNSHLFLADKMDNRFPGRKFKINAVTTMNKKDLHNALHGIERANISVRNFPMTAENLRRRLKLKDGGDIYIFATTAGTNHLLFICEKAEIKNHCQ